MSCSEEAYMHGLCTMGCAQIIYAQGERLSTLAPIASTNKKTTRRSITDLARVNPQNIYVTTTVADVLADIAGAFIRKVGRAAQAQAEHSGRTQCTLEDCVNVLTELKHLTKSTVRDIAKHAMFREIPFPYDIPNSPVQKQQSKKNKGTEHLTSIVSRKYLDVWMPRIPDHLVPEENIGDDSWTTKLGIEKCKAKIMKMEDKRLRGTIQGTFPQNKYVSKPKFQ